jgi:hypothetical protein
MEFVAIRFYWVESALNLTVPVCADSFLIAHSMIRVEGLSMAGWRKQICWQQSGLHFENMNLFLFQYST